VLQRAVVNVRSKNLKGAIEELSALKGRPAEAMSGWVEEARRRLILEQALQLLNAHSASISASMN